MAEIKKKQSYFENLVAVGYISLPLFISHIGYDTVWYSLFSQPRL